MHIHSYMRIIYKNYNNILFGKLNRILLYNESVTTKLCMVFVLMCVH